MSTIFSFLWDRVPHEGEPADDEKVVFAIQFPYKMEDVYQNDRSALSQYLRGLHGFIAYYSSATFPMTYIYYFRHSVEKAHKYAKKVDCEHRVMELCVKKEYVDNAMLRSEKIGKAIRNKKYYARKKRERLKKS